MTNLPVPSPRTFTVGETETAAYFNAVRDALNFLLNPPVAEIYQTTAQSVPNSAWTSVTFDSTLQDTYGMHSNVTNNSRLTAIVAGTYEFSGGPGFASNATGIRGGTWAKNGGIIGTAGASTLLTPVSGSTTAFAVPTLQIPMVPGDYVEMQVFQSSGGALALNTGQYGPQVGVKWIHS